MALIKCPECGNNVSTKAVACPHCGAPIASAGERIAAGAPITTTQLTSKKFKGQRVIAVLMIIIGAVWMSLYAGDPTVESSEGLGWATLMLLVGMVWYIVVRIRTWWHHG